MEKSSERPEKAAEHRIDRVEISVTVGEWRGTLKVGEKSTGQAVCLFAKGDGGPLPWGRALEELLRELLAKAETAGDESRSGTHP